VGLVNDVDRPACLESFGPAGLVDHADDADHAHRTQVHTRSIGPAQLASRTPAGSLEHRFAPRFCQGFCLALGLGLAFAARPRVTP
jgi:hypothetical protein